MKNVVTDKNLTTPLSQGTTAYWLQPQAHPLTLRATSAQSGTIARRVPLIKYPAQRAHTWMPLNRMKKQIVKIARLGSTAQELDVSCPRATALKDITVRGDRIQLHLLVIGMCC